MLEEKLGKLYVNLSLHQTLDQLLRERSCSQVCRWRQILLRVLREVKLADKLKSEFKLSERKYFWLKVHHPICCSLRWNIFKVKAFGESGQWTELNALAKTKKSPIGFAPFLDVCLKQVKFVVSLDLWYYLKGWESTSCQVPLTARSRGQTKVGFWCRLSL